MIEDPNRRVLTRECEAILIPGGETVTLPNDTAVVISQVLGGSYTVMTPHGLARISGENADALGEEPKTEEPAAQHSEDHEGPPDNEALWEQLKNVYDPEIPVNIVDLGLVYSCEITETQPNFHRVDVKMTLTAPGCGMGPAIAADAKAKVLSVPGVKDAEVEIVWDPPWNQEMITEEGKMKLGLI